MEDGMNIRVTYHSIDGHKESFDTTYLSVAQRWASRWIGKSPSLGRGYAVSDDGIGKITVEGASLRELFPDGF